jgi:hypothetical protein
MFENEQNFEFSKSHRGVPRQATPIIIGIPLKVVTLDPRVEKFGPAHFRFVTWRCPKNAKKNNFSKIFWGYPHPTE